MTESKRNSENGPLEERDHETVTESGEKEKIKEDIRLLREGIEKAIPRLLEIADSIDATNNAITAATIVANMTNVTSCLFNIVAAFLAPFTMGTSVALTASGMGLATVSATTRKLIGTFREFNSKKKEKADEVIKVCTTSIKNSKTKLKGLGSSICQETEEIMEKITASNINEQASNLADQVSNISDQFSNMTSTKETIATMNISVHIREMKEKIKEMPIPKIISKVPYAIMSLLEEILSMIENLQHLTNRAEAAANIRETVNKLKGMLLKLNEDSEELEKHCMNSRAPNSH